MNTLWRKNTESSEVSYAFKEQDIRFYLFEEVFMDAYSSILLLIVTLYPHSSLQSGKDKRSLCYACKPPASINEKKTSDFFHFLWYSGTQEQWN